MDDWGIVDPFEEKPADEPRGVDGTEGQQTPGGVDGWRGVETPSGVFDHQADEPPPGDDAGSGYTRTTNGSGSPFLQPIGGYTRPHQQAAGGTSQPQSAGPASEPEEPRFVPSEPDLTPTTPLPLEPEPWRDVPDVYEPGESGEPAWQHDDLETASPTEPPRRSGRTSKSTPPGGRSWVYAVAGLVLGLLIGGGLLLWMRTAMLADQRSLNDRLKAVEASATASADEVATLTQSLAQAEASITALASQNQSLTAQLESATTALTTANSKLAIANKTLTIIERSVSPGSVVKDKPLTLEVKIQGAADKVEMKVVGVSPLTYSKVFTLTKVSTASGIQTWRKTIEAPSTVGMYRYYATAYIGTKEFTMPGVSAWTFEVTPGP